RGARRDRPGLKLLARAVHTHIDCQSDNFVAPLFLEPADGDGGIEAAGISEDDLLRHGYGRSKTRGYLGPPASNRARTRSTISIAPSISSSNTVSGGMKRSAVGLTLLTSNPSSEQTPIISSATGRSSSSAQINPLPRTSVIIARRSASEWSLRSM